MNEEEQAQMEKYGITAETRLVYSFQNNRYQSLKDAVRYAELMRKRDAATPKE